MTKEMKLNPTSVTETELWKLRALDAQQGRLQAEGQLTQQRLAEVSNKMQELVDELRAKYGDAEVGPEGQLIYGPPKPMPGVAGKPDIPDVPESEEEEEDDEEE